MFRAKVNDSGVAKSKSGKTFHHGQLRTALLQAALSAVELSGHHELSLRELASELGVSSAAPYRHYADRVVLLSAVACVGYRDVVRRHTEAIATAGDPLTGLRRAMRDFLEFSKARRHLFQLMYSDLIREPRRLPDLIEAEDNMYALATSSLAAVLPDLSRRALRLRMMTSWATLYGHALLSGRHMVKPYLTTSLSEKQIDAAVVDAAIGPIVHSYPLECG